MQIYNDYTIHSSTCHFVLLAPVEVCQSACCRQQAPQLPWYRHAMVTQPRPSAATASSLLCTPGPPARTRDNEGVVAGVRLRLIHEDCFKSLLYHDKARSRPCLKKLTLNVALARRALGSLLPRALLTGVTPCWHQWRRARAHGQRRTPVSGGPRRGETPSKTQRAHQSMWQRKQARPESMERTLARRERRVVSVRCY